MKLGMCIGHGTYRTAGMSLCHIRLRIRRYPPIFPKTRHLPGTSVPWDFDARSTPDSKKLTLRDCAVVLLYGQISSHPPMAFKGFSQIQIATEIGQSESHVCSGWSNTTHITKIAPFLLKCGGYGSPNRPHGPQITPGHIPNNTWSTHKHT